MFIFSERSKTFLYVDQRGRWHLFLTTNAKFSACLLVNFDQLESFLVSNLTLDLTRDLSTGHGSSESLAGIGIKLDKLPKILRETRNPRAALRDLCKHRFSAFWLRSKCSICSYQLNI